MFSRNGLYEIDAERHIAAGNRVNGALAALMRRRNVSTAARFAVHNAVLLYDGETWVLHKKEGVHEKSMRTLRRACMKRLMTVDEAKEVCGDRSV